MTIFSLDIIFLASTTGMLLFVLLLLADYCRAGKWKHHSNNPATPFQILLDYKLLQLIDAFSFLKTVVDAVCLSVGAGFLSRDTRTNGPKIS